MNKTKLKQTHKQETNAVYQTQEGWGGGRDKGD